MKQEYINQYKQWFKEWQKVQEENKQGNFTNGYAKRNANGDILIKHNN